MVARLRRLLARLRYGLQWKLPQPIRNRLLARQLARDPDYSYTTDYVAHVESHWQELLAELRDRPGVRILEIGSYEGRSTVWFLQNVLTHPSASISCVDSWRWAEDELRFDHNVHVSGRAGQVTKLKGPSDAVLPQLPTESFDLVYVDGSHRAVDVLMDGVLAWERLKPGGMVIFDDYLWKPEKPPHERPQMAIDLFLELFEGRCEVLLKDYQVAVRRAT